MRSAQQPLCGAGGPGRRAARVPFVYEAPAVTPPLRDRTVLTAAGVPGPDEEPARMLPTGYVDNYELLLALARDPQPASRNAVFGKVSRLLVDDIRTDQNRERALAAEILLRLLHEVDVRLRWELATHLAARADAPPDLIVALASDDAIEVARPVLLESPLLSDCQLIRIIHGKTEGHRLAIARRKALSERVSRALIDSKDTAAVSAALANDGAAFSEEMLAVLVEDAQWQAAYREPLVHRRELPKALARRLYRWVGKPLKDALLKRFDIGREVLAEDIERIIDQELDRAVPPAAPVPRVGPAADGLAEPPPPAPALLVGALERGDTVYFEELLAALSGLALPLVRRLAYDPTGAGLIVVCHAAEVDPETFVQVYRLTRRNGDVPVEPSAADVAGMARSFRDVPVALARKIAWLGRTRT